MNNILNKWRHTPGEVDLSSILKKENNCKQVIPPFNSNEYNTYEELVSDIEVRHLIESNNLIKEVFITLSEHYKEKDVYDVRDCTIKIIYDDKTGSRMIMKMIFLLRLVKFHRRFKQSWMRLLFSDSIHWKFQYRVIIFTLDNLVTDEIIKQRMIEITKSMKSSVKIEEEEQADRYTWSNKQEEKK